MSYTYTVPQLEAQTRLMCRNANSSSSAYTPAQIQSGIIRAINEWSRETREGATLTQLQLAAGSQALPTPPAGMTAEKIIEAYLTLAGHIIRPYLNITNAITVLELQHLYPQPTNPPTIPSTGRPCNIAFQGTSPASIIFDCTPNQTFVLNLWWYPDPIVWTPGNAATYPTPPLSLPDQSFNEICGGAVWEIQGTEPANQKAAAIRRAHFEAKMREAKGRGAGSRGAMVLPRQSTGYGPLSGSGPRSLM